MAGTLTKTIQNKSAVSTPAAGTATEFIDTSVDALGLPSTKRSDGSVIAPVFGTRAVNTTAPLTGGGDLTADRTFAISAATGSTAGSLSAADKTKLDTLTSGAAVASVGGTLPIVSSGGTTPAISINAATGSLPGSLSAADKTKLDTLTSGAAVASVGGTAPIVSSGGTAPTVSINAATGTAAGSMAAADKKYLDAQAYGVFNVRAYGALADNTADDTTSIQSAVTAAVAFLAGGNQRGAIVYFPPGIYKVTAVITGLAGNGLVLMGAGRGQTTIATNMATGDYITLPSGGEDWAIRGLQFFASVTRSAGAFINTNGCNDVIIDDFVMSGAFVGISVQGGSIKVSITNGVISSTVAATGVGISVVNGAAGDTYIGPRLIFSNGAGARPLACIRLQQTGHCQIEGVNATSGVSGLLIDPATSQDVTYVFVSHSLFDSSGTQGMLINPANVASARVRSLKFVNSWFSGSVTGAGAFLSTQGASAIVDDIEFVECRFLNNGTHGVAHAFGTNVRFLGGTVAGNSAVSSGVSDGINIAAGVSVFTIEAVRSGPVGTATNTQRFGLNILAGASTEYVVNGCDFTGNVTGTYSDNGTGTNKLVAGNLGGALNSLPITAATAGLNTTETVLNTTPTGLAGLQVGTTYRLTAYGTCTATVANASTFTLRYGTAGTIADAAFATGVVTSAATGTAVPFKVEIVFTVRALGATSTVVGAMTVMSQGLATGTSSGIAAFSVTSIALTATATLNTPLNGILSLTYKSAATTTTSTFQVAFIEAIKA